MGETIQIHGACAWGVNPTIFFCATKLLNDVNDVTEKCETLIHKVPEIFFLQFLREAL